MLTLRNRPPPQSRLSTCTGTEPGYGVRGPLRLVPEPPSDDSAHKRWATLEGACGSGERRPDLLLVMKLLQAEQREHGCDLPHCWGRERHEDSGHDAG